MRLNTKIDDSFPFTSFLLSSAAAAATRRCSGQNVFLHSSFFSLFSLCFCLRRGPLISFSYSLLLPNSNRAMNFTTTWAPCFSTSSPPPLLYLILSLVYALSSSEIQTRHVINNCCYVWNYFLAFEFSSLIFCSQPRTLREKNVSKSWVVYDGKHFFSSLFCLFLLQQKKRVEGNIEHNLMYHIPKKFVQEAFFYIRFSLRFAQFNFMLCISSPYIYIS